MGDPVATLVHGMPDPGERRSGPGWPPRHDRPILRRLAGAFGAGFAGGAVTATALIVADVGGIGALTLGAGASSGDPTGALLLIWGMAVLFGFVGLAISIMSLGDWTDSPPD